MIIYENKPTNVGQIALERQAGQFISEGALDWTTFYGCTKFRLRKGSNSQPRVLSKHLLDGYQVLMGGSVGQQLAGCNGWKGIFHCTGPLTA